MRGLGWLSFIILGDQASNLFNGTWSNACILTAAITGCRWSFLVMFRHSACLGSHARAINITILNTTITLRVLKLASVRLYSPTRLATWAQLGLH